MEEEITRNAKRVTAPPYTVLVDDGVLGKNLPADERDVDVVFDADRDGQRLWEECG